MGGMGVSHVGRILVSVDAQGVRIIRWKFAVRYILTCRVYQFVQQEPRQGNGLATADIRIFFMEILLYNLKMYFAVSRSSNEVSDD